MKTRYVIQYRERRPYARWVEAGMGAAISLEAAQDQMQRYVARGVYNEEYLFRLIKKVENVLVVAPAQPLPSSRRR